MIGERVVNILSRAVAAWAWCSNISHCFYDRDHRLFPLVACPAARKVRLRRDRLEPVALMSGTLINYRIYLLVRERSIVEEESIR